MKKKHVYFALTLLVFLALFIKFNPIFQSQPTDSIVYIQGVENNDVGAFSMPLMYYLGLLIAPYFWILPAFSLFGSLTLMYLISLKEKINFLYYPTLLLLTPVWMPFGLTFHRDALFLFLSTTTLFFLYLFEKEQKTNLKITYLGFALIAILGAIMNKAGSQALLIVVIIYLMTHFLKETKILEKLTMGGYWMLFKFPTKIISFIAWVSNPIYIIFALSLLKKRSMNSIGIFLAIILSCAFVYNFGYDLTHTYRYTFFFVPFASYYIAKANPKKMMLLIVPIAFIFNTTPYLMRIAQLGVKTIA